MMPPWKQSSDTVAFNLLQSDPMTVMQLEKPGQKRRRSNIFMPGSGSSSSTTTQDQFNMYNENLPTERVSNDSVQLSGLEPYPQSTGGNNNSNNMFGGSLQESFPTSERRGYYSSRMFESSGIFPFRAPEVVPEHSSGLLNSSANSSLFLGGNSADFLNANQYRSNYHGHRSLDSAAAATAQAMANFQALIDQGRSKSSGFQAYNGNGNSTTQVSATQVPATQVSATQVSGFGLPTTTSSGFNYFSMGSGHGFQDLNSSVPLSFEDSAATTVNGANGTYHGANGTYGATGTYGANGANGLYGANGTYNGIYGSNGAVSETTWPNLTCQTSSVRNTATQSTLFQDPPSPCTPRGNRRSNTVLTDSQEEYLQHMERINSEALSLSADTPAHHHSSRGRRLSYINPSSPPERSSRGDYNNNNNNNIINLFHPFDTITSGASESSKHLHVYFDDSGMPQHVEVEDDNAATTTTQVDECVVSGTRGIRLFCEAPAGEDYTFQEEEENYSQSFEPPAVVVAGEKENVRSSNNVVDQFDLNEVPVVGAGECGATTITPSKVRKKYHPRVAKDKRTYKRRVDGKKVPGIPGDGFTNTESPAKKSSKKRPTQTTTTMQYYDDEGRDSSYPEVVDMDIEDNNNNTVAANHHLHTTMQLHDTAVCDCEACIKFRLERRNPTTIPHQNFIPFDDPQSPVSPPERHSHGNDNSPDSSSNSPSVRRTLFQAPESNQAEAPARRLPFEFDSIPPQSNAMVLSQSNATAYANVKSFFNTGHASSSSSCLQQFNESATQLGFSNWNGNQQQQIRVTKPSFDWNPPTTFAQAHRTAAAAAAATNFMSRLCPRGILSPQNIPFRNMNQIQRVLYLKSILTSNFQLTMSPESLLRHVFDHLPEDEKDEFKSSLWPIILKPLSDEQMKQLENYANGEKVEAPVAMVVTKRKPGPKPKKANSKKELAMTLWPDLVVQKSSNPKPGKGRKSKINADSGQNGLEIVPYENGEKSLVPYEINNKTVVPYDGPFNPLKKRKPRPKVVLDNETVRVWKLLMGKTTNNGGENVNMDAENEQKWEEERRKMKAQALLFIDRMHIVQGDRSFSCWKGSVVDSVVGAFLTQNVNDVLSSSAFMSMRSRFPAHGFRKSSAHFQTKNPETSEETVAQSFHNSPSSSPIPQTSTTTTENITPHSFPPPPSTNITVLESQESQNEQNYNNHLEVTITQTKPPANIEVISESASTTISEDNNNNLMLPQSEEKASNSQSENSSGLEYQMVPEELSNNNNNNSQVDVVSREFNSGTEGINASLVELVHEASHGKYNPKTGLTGLERAKIEEKQVTARKSFDFSGLQEEFKPRLAGEERAPAPPRTEMTEDGVDWEAVRSANVQEVADVIKERGLNWILAGRIKAFLERIHLDYGALDLEWLRSMSTDQTKEFLLSIRGLGLKSVECIRLLTLHHLAFPVDTNVGRICVRLGWVPLEPLPEELQLHLLELYPVQATIQKYLWPRLCKLDQQTLYELHYQMITFGKVFCTKSKPNCNACPMRPECKHFASALSSAKLALPASERPNNGPTLALPPGTTPTKQDPPQDRAPEPPRPVSQYCQPIVEEPMTPESEADMEEFDIEDYPFTVEEVEDDDTDMNICIQNQSNITDPQQAPTQLVQQSESINNPNCCSILSITDTYVTISEPEPVSEPVSEVISEPISEPVHTTIMEDWGGLATSGSNSVQLGGCEQSESVIKIVESVNFEEVLDLESNVVDNHPSEVLIHPNGALSSHEMVLVNPGTASLPVPKLKNVGRLRTVHYVYELPDNHPLLDGLDPREHDDPCTYLLAIWSPGEVPESIPNMNDTGHEENPFASSSSEGEESIKATLLVPCRTAMQGSFPLNGTYFQVNEVFADHSSSLQPMIVPRTLLWNLRRRYVFFGTSVTSIFRGMTVEEIQACFWRGYVCVRGFDRTTRAPKPLVGRLHLQAGKSSGKGANAES